MLFRYLLTRIPEACKFIVAVDALSIVRLALLNAPLARGAVLRFRPLSFRLMGGWRRVDHSSDNIVAATRNVTIFNLFAKMGAFHV
ncbi:MAG TPA: hypothetical protein VIF02_03650 [Methylocella sp.]|jgi:hypothetical protein